MHASVGREATQGTCLSRTEKLSYGAGELASNLAWNMATGFLLIYYTDVALLPVAALGTLMLVTRILDAIFDPLAGILVDRSQSKRGKARPFLLFASVPFALLFIATFSVPDVSPGAKLVYAYVTFTVLGLLYSMLYVPYSSMLPMLTRRQGEKIELGGFRAMGSSLASILAYGLTMPVVAAFGPDRQLGFTVAATIMGIGTAAIYLVTYRNCREHHAMRDTVKRSVGERIGKLIRNPVWRIAFANSLLIFVRIGVMVSSLAFFCKDVLGRPALVAVILTAMSVSIFLGGAFARRFIVRIGLVPGNIVALAVQSMLYLCLIPAEFSPALFAIIFIVSQFTGGIGAASNFRLGADAVEWHENSFGHRDEGLMASGISFGTKVGIAIGTSVTAYALGFAGYNPSAATPDANTALRWLTYAAPIVLNSLMILCWLRLKHIQSGTSEMVTETQGA